MVTLNTFSNYLLTSQVEFFPEDSSFNCHVFDLSHTMPREWNHGLVFDRPKNSRDSLSYVAMEVFRESVSHWVYKPGSLPCSYLLKRTFLHPKDVITSSTRKEFNMSDLVWPSSQTPSDSSSDSSDEPPPSYNSDTSLTDVPAYSANADEEIAVPQPPEPIHPPNLIPLHVANPLMLPAHAFQRQGNDDIVTFQASGRVAPVEPTAPTAPRTLHQMKSLAAGYIRDHEERQRQRRRQPPGPNVLEPLPQPARPARPARPALALRVQRTQTRNERQIYGDFILYLTFIALTFLSWGENRPIFFDTTMYGHALRMSAPTMAVGFAFVTCIAIIPFHRRPKTNAAIARFVASLAAWALILVAIGASYFLVKRGHEKQRRK